MRHDLIGLGNGGRQLQISAEIHLPQFHQDAHSTRCLVENPRIDQPHDMLVLENEDRKNTSAVLNTNTNNLQYRRTQDWEHADTRIALISSSV